MPQQKRNLIGAATVIFLMVAIGLWQWLQPHPLRLRGVNSEQSVCSLVGEIKNPRKDAAGFGTLGGHVRLQFEANRLEDCQHAVSGYCRGRLNEGLVPGNLKMLFRTGSNPKESEHFKVTSHCLFERTEGNER